LLAPGKPKKYEINIIHTSHSAGPQSSLPM